MLHEGHAYVGHMFSDGITVLDVRDPRVPQTRSGFVACPPNTRSHHIQVHDGILLATNSANIWAMQRYANQADYFTAPLADSFSRREREFTAGLRVFSLDDPASPHEIGFLPRGRVSGCTASGGWAGATPMRRAISTGSPTMCWPIFDVSEPHQTRTW